MRCAGTVGRVNQVISDVRKEVPAASSSVRKVLENAERITSDVADASSVIKDAAATVRMIVERVRDAVKFLDENIFSKLAALAPLFTMVGSWIERISGKKKEPSGKGEEAAEGNAD